MSMAQFYSYVAYLLAASGLLVVFVLVYSRLTPYREVAMIRAGRVAPAISLGGAMLGFSLTLAASIQHNDTLFMFLVWAVCAMLVQALAYALLARVMPRMAEELEADNIAMGTLMACVAIAVGLINAACLS
jgi:putative membrane protein